MKLLPGDVLTAEEKNTPPKGANARIHTPSASKDIDPEIDTIGTNARDAKQESQETYTNDEASSTIEGLKDNQSTVKDEYNPDSLYENYGDKLSVNTPKGNLNAKDFAETLDLSRQADARNNMLVRGPQDIGGYYAGGNDIMPDVARYGKLPPIETEEMRQMQMNRDVEASSRKHSEELQAKLQQYKYELQRMSDQQVMQLLYNIGYDEHKFNDLVRKVTFDLRYTQPGLQKINFIMQRMLQGLGLFMNQEVVNALYEAWFSTPTLARMYASISHNAELPEATQYVLDQWQAGVMNKGLSPMEIISAMSVIKMLGGNLTAMMTGEAFSNAPAAALQGYGGATRSETGEKK